MTICPVVQNRHPRKGIPVLDSLLKLWPVRTRIMFLILMGYAFAGMTFLSPLHAGLFVGEGATALSSLKIPTSARASAMGGAFGSVSGDVSALEYNPAGLANMVRTDFLASYISYIEDSSLQSLSIGFPVRFDDRKTIYEPSESENMFLPRRLGVGIQYRAFNASDEERTNTGVKLSDFDIRDQVLAVGLSYPVGWRLAVGATGKYIGSKLQDESANTFALDTGFQFKLGHFWSAGGAIQNIGSSKAYIEQKDPLPTTVRAGVGRQTDKSLFTLDVTEGRDNILKESAGVEFGVGPYVKVRGGIFNDSNVEFTGGLGIRFQGPQKAPVLTAPRKQVNSDTPERNTLNDLGAPPKEDDGGGSIKTLFSNTDIGLDYGLATHKDLGIIHTISLRILY